MSEHRSRAEEHSSRKGQSEHRSAAEEHSSRQGQSEHRSAAEEHSSRQGQSEQSSPVDRILELALYAPVGLAISAVEGLPHWVEVGRRQVESRLSTARVVGRLAVDQGSRQGGQVLRRVAEQADTVMAGLGLVPDVAQPPPEPQPEASGTDGPSAATSARASSPSAGSAPVGLDPAQLAIPGYDTLSASQVVQRLTGLSAEELEAVCRYEAAGRARKTILLKAAQLQNGP